MSQIKRFPNGLGATTAYSAYGAATTWEAVNEATADDDASYAFKVGGDSAHGFTLSLGTVPAGSTINVVRYVARVRAANAADAINLIPRILVGGVAYSGAQVSITDSYVDYTSDYGVNPATGLAWTIDEVNGNAGANNLEGILLRNTGTSGTEEIRCTQCYVLIDFTPSATMPVIDNVNVNNVVTDGGNLVITGSALNTANAVVLSDGTLSAAQALANQSATQIGPNAVQRGNLPYADANHSFYIEVSNGTDTPHQMPVQFNPPTGFAVITIADPLLDGTSLLQYVTAETPGDGWQLKVPLTTRNQAVSVSVAPNGRVFDVAMSGTDYLDGVELWNAVSWSGPVTITLIEGVPVDSWDPIVQAPADLAVILPAGFTTVNQTDSVITAWLNSATAADETAPASPAVSNDCPAILELANSPITITFTATDSAGNTGSASATVTLISDNTAPVVTAPTDKTVTLAFAATDISRDDVGIQAWLASAGAVDETSPATPVVTNDCPAILLLSASPITITFSATDNAGNQGSASAQLALVSGADTQAPVITVPQALQALIALGNNTLAKSRADVQTWLTSATASDNSGETPGVFNNCPDVMNIANSPITVTFTATDSAGNVGVATAQIIITDGAVQGPSASPPNDIAITLPLDSTQLDRNHPSVQTFLSGINAVDNNAPDNLIITNDCPPVMRVIDSPVTITWTLYDPDSNTQITVSADIHIITSGAAAGPILPARSAVYHYDTQTAAYHRRGDTTDALSELIDIDDD